MSKYITRQDDKFEDIARNVYGDEQAARYIASANPGLFEPLVAGVSVFFQDAVALQLPVPAENDDEVAITIEGKPFRFFESVRIQRVFDGLDSAQFTAPFDPSDPEHRENFRPFSYKEVTVSVGGVKLFTGTMIGVSPDVQPNRSSVTITAYAKAGVLQDCTASASDYPVEFNNVKLDGIAAKLCAPFSVAATFETDPGPVFDRVATQPGQTVWNFLSTLARQRNQIIGNDENGDLVFRQSVTTGQPSAILTEGLSPLNTVRSTFSQQKYYSSITGLVPMLVGLEGPQFTVRNEHLQEKFRPFTFTVSDSDDAQAEAAVQAKTGYMFGQMASYDIEVIGWRDESGSLWGVGTIISLQAPGAMIYEPFDFVVRSVTFDRAAGQKSATLNLVLPGSYSGEIPGALPWD